LPKNLSEINSSRNYLKNCNLKFLKPISSQSPPNFVTRGVPQAHPSSVIQRNPDYMNSMTSVNCGQMHSLIPQALMHGPLPSLYQNFGTIRQNIAPPQQNYSPFNTFSLPHFYVQMPTSANQPRIFQYTIYLVAKL
jgi:hypothetical protein